MTLAIVPSLIVLILLPGGTVFSQALTPVERLAGRSSGTTTKSGRLRGKSEFSQFPECAPPPRGAKFSDVPDMGLDFETELEGFYEDLNRTYNLEIEYARESQIDQLTREKEGEMSKKRMENSKRSEQVLPRRQH